MPTVPPWVGKPAHVWKPQLGGGVWYQGASTLNAVKPILKEYPRPALVGLRSDFAQEGYRFDLDTWSPNAKTFSYWTDRCSTEHVLKILENSNCEFIWSMPTPDHYSPTPYADGVPKGSAYPWQTPEYYAAYLQYLIGSASHSAAKVMKNAAFNFFTDESCTKINEESEEAVGNNWANLRAKRGRLAPYPIQAVILGIEPYGDAQETMQVNGADSGAKYGDIVLRFRNAIRARRMPNIPLGLNIAGFYPMSDFGRPWFKPLFDKLGNLRHDFSYLDMHHHYHFGSPGDEKNRIFPGMINVTPIGGSVFSSGWQNSWFPRSSWQGVDYSRYLWMYEDVRLALQKIGENSSRWKLGCAEHGMAITSQFKGNDMGAAIHWALWLSESMRYNAVWDMNWNFMETGFSHAQMHVRDGKITRTPGHFVYKMCQEFYGFELLDNSFESPTTALGEDQGAKYSSPDVVVRVFRNPASGNHHLFVINKNALWPAPIKGWESWKVKSWKQLRAESFTAMNPIGNHSGPWHPETIKTFNTTHVSGSLSIPAISVNHIELAVA